MISKAIDQINKANLKKDQVAFSVGDMVKVHVKIREGDKERVQVYAGTVIAKDGGSSTETFTVRRISHGVGVERVFPVHSPHIAAIEVESSSQARRAKLYYTRHLTTKEARLRETQSHQQ